RILLPDVIVCLWITLAIFFFWKSLEEETPSLVSACGFAACCALGVLAKGLIGVIFPVAIAGIYLFFTRSLRHILRWHPAIGTLVFLLIAAPWHVLAGLQNPAQGNVHGFFWFYFVNEHLLRFIGHRVAQDSDSIPLWVFWLLLFVFIAPWCIFALKMAARLPWDAVLRRGDLNPR